MQKAAPGTRERIAQIIMAVVALGAAIAGIDAFPRVADMPSATKVVEAWRLVGFFTFSALFALLAARPKTDKTVWLIVIFNKFALTVAGIILATAYDSVAHVGELIAVDGGLTVIILIAYLLSRAGRTDRP